MFCTLQPCGIALAFLQVWSHFHYMCLACTDEGLASFACTGLDKVL